MRVLSIPHRLVGLVKPHVKGAAIEHGAVQGADAVGTFFRSEIPDDAARKRWRGRVMEGEGGPTVSRVLSDENGKDIFAASLRVK